MHFYKIINRKEKHNGLWYKTGLNTDILPWNPSGNCEKGGIYFSREDILAFIDYGPWIRKVTIPEGIEVYENPGEPNKWKAHKVILGKREKISVDVIKRLLEEGANVHAENDWAFRWASKKGYLGIVKFLLEHGAAIHAIDDCAFGWASKNGHLEVIKFLLKHGANIHADNDCALRWASENGHLEVVILLLKHGANIHANNDCALKWASESGRLKIVRLLLEHGADVHSKDDFAIRLARKDGHTQVVKLLLEHIRGAEERWKK